MIRNIIFDVGKVLVSYEPDAYMQRLGISKENQKKINEAMFQNELWDTSDQGLGTPDEFLQKFIAGAPELADEITKIHKTVGNTVELFLYAMEWILDLKARGYHVYILSNYSENMLDQTKDKLKFLPLMDGVVFSYKIKKSVSMQTYDSTPCICSPHRTRSIFSGLLPDKYHKPQVPPVSGKTMPWHTSAHFPPAH